MPISKIKANFWVYMKPSMDITISSIQCSSVIFNINDLDFMMNIISKLVASFNKPSITNNLICYPYSWYKNRQKSFPDRLSFPNRLQPATFSSDVWFDFKKGLYNKILINNTLALFQNWLLPGQPKFTNPANREWTIMWSAKNTFNVVYTKGIFLICMS